MNELFERNLKIETLKSMATVTQIHCGAFNTETKEFRQKISKTKQWAMSLSGLTLLDEPIRVVYLDNPQITASGMQKTGFCIPVEQRGELELRDSFHMEGGIYAVLHIETALPQVFQQAWQWLFVTWLPMSGYQHTGQPPFEKYMNNPDQHPEGLEIVEICVPVKRI
jgi:AraC family transcriptional regulator